MYRCGSDFWMSLVLALTWVFLGLGLGLGSMSLALALNTKSLKTSLTSSHWAYAPTELAVADVKDKFYLALSSLHPAEPTVILGGFSAVTGRQSNLHRSDVMGASMATGHQITTRRDCWTSVRAAGFQNWRFLDPRQGYPPHEQVLQWRIYLKRNRSRANQLQNCRIHCSLEFDSDLETCAGTHSCSHSHPSWQFYFPHPSLTRKIFSLTRPAPTRLFPFPAPPLAHYSLSPFTHVNKKNSICNWYVLVLLLLLLLKLYIVHFLHNCTLSTWGRKDRQKIK